jgi:hypothetical protein
MDAVIKALMGAARSLVHPIILMILLVPMLIALALWIGVGWAYWGTWTSAIQNAVVDHTTFTWAANWDMARLASWIAAAVVLAILAPVVIVTALLIATLFAMPVLVRHVAQSNYPNLELRHGGTVIGTTESRKYRSSRNDPWLIPAFRSTLVAAMIRASLVNSCRPPTR